MFNVTAFQSLEDEALEIDLPAGIMASKYEGVADEIPENNSIQSTNEDIGKECEVEADTFPLSAETEPDVGISTVLPWKDLCTSLQSVLPNGKSLTYVVTSFTQAPTCAFSGAPSHAFTATVCINIHSKEEAQSWLQQMMDHSKCTYRHTKGRTPGLKRVMFKAEMHSQHFKKSLTPKQQSQSALARCKNSRKALMHDVRNKKTECPSTLKLTVNIPTKRDKFSANRSVTHPTVLAISFMHNHPVESAHVLSFRPIAKETRNKIFDYLLKGHTASSAHHWHETKLLLEHEQNQSLLADRNINPTKADFYRLYDEWRKKDLGPDQGKPLFDQLNNEIAAYNDAYSANEGKAALQIFKGLPTEALILIQKQMVKLLSNQRK